MKYLKTYEGYFEDDVNSNITATVIDIFQDLTEDSDFDVTCFTIGYKTLNQYGAKHSDNDISLSIVRNYQEHEVAAGGNWNVGAIDMLKPQTTYKSFTLDEVLPYIKRTAEYMESEGKPINSISYQYRHQGRRRPGSGKLQQKDIQTIDELMKSSYTNFENIQIKFGTGHFSTGENVDENKLFESSDIILDTINDILIEVNNDLDEWSAKAWIEKYEGSATDIVVIMRRDGEFNEDNYPNEWSIIKHMKIPDGVFDTIKRMIGYMGSYECDIFIGDDNTGPGENNEPCGVEMTDGKLIDINGSYVDKLWYNEFIKIVFSK